MHSPAFVSCAKRHPSYYGCPEFSLLHSTIDSPIARHVDAEYFIGFHFSGRSRCFLPGKGSLEFGPRDIGFIRPGTVHEEALLTPWVEYLGIKIRPEYFERLWASFRGTVALPEGQCSRVEGDERFTSVGCALRTELVNRELGHEIMIQNLVEELVVHLFRRLVPGCAGLDKIDPERQASEVRWQVRRAMQYLQAHYNEEFDLESTAAFVGSSKFYLVRLFRSATGLTLNGYLQQLRVQKGKELLLEPSRSVSTVAMELGFSDQSHFTRVFKRFTGLTPLVFRQGAR